MSKSDLLSALKRQKVPVKKIMRIIKKKQAAESGAFEAAEEPGKKSYQTQVGYSSVMEMKKQFRNEVDIARLNKRGILLDGLRVVFTKYESKERGRGVQKEAVEGSGGCGRANLGMRKQITVASSQGETATRQAEMSQEGLGRESIGSVVGSQPGLRGAEANNQGSGERRGSARFELSGRMDGIQEVGQASDAGHDSPNGQAMAQESVRGPKKRKNRIFKLEELTNETPNFETTHHLLSTRSLFRHQPHHRFNLRFNFGAKSRLLGLQPFLTQNRDF